MYKSVAFSTFTKWCNQRRWLFPELEFYFSKLLRDATLQQKEKMRGFALKRDQ